MTSRDIDLSLTIRELSNSYEELSLLYRMSEVFSFLSIDEICVRITREAVNTIGVQTAAVLFLNENSDMLYTKTCQGKWDCERVIDKAVDVIWRPIGSRKTSAYCRLIETEHKKHFPELSSLMICPIVGKARVIGAIVVADKDSGEEFFSNDSKLLSTIAS